MQRGNRTPKNARLFIFLWCAFFAADNVNAEAAREITDGVDVFEAHAKAETAKYATID